MPSKIGEVLRLHCVQQRQAQLWLLQRDEKRVHALPQTASDGTFAQAVAEDVFQEAVGGVGKLLPAVDECVPVAMSMWQMERKTMVD